MGNSPTESSSHEIGSSLATSATFIGRVQGDDPRAWDRLVKLYGPLIERWCRRWGLQSHDVADVLQEVFQSLAVHVREFRKQRTHDTFRGWLRVITRNKVLDHFRRLGREPAGVGGSEALKRLVGIAGAADDDSSDEKPGAAPLASCWPARAGCNPSQDAPNCGRRSFPTRAARSQDSAAARQASRS
ncbi:MAG: RNA polymerase sigma factor [Pirellulales bacterium]